MERLREYMTERKLTQGELATLLGVSQPTVSDWISGKMKPSADRLIEISERTGLTVDELLKRRKSEKRKRAA